MGRLCKNNILEPSCRSSKEEKHANHSLESIVKLHKYCDYNIFYNVISSMIYHHSISCYKYFLQKHILSGVPNMAASRSPKASTRRDLEGSSSRRTAMDSRPFLASPNLS